MTGALVDVRAPVHPQEPTSDGLSILHVVNGLRPGDGGTTRVVIDLADALSETCTLRVSVLAQGLLDAPASLPKSQNVACSVIESSSRNALALGRPIRTALESRCRVGDVSVMHGHGIWTAANHWTSRAAARHQIPLVLQPHGMLEPWALNHKRVKKELAMRLFQRTDIAISKALVATSEDEYLNLRKLGLDQPIAIIPNGVSEPQSVSRSQTLDSRQRTLLFLSRIHPKKGLLNLVQAWSIVRPVQWKLKIAGPDECGHLREVKSEAARLGLDDAIEYVGEVHGSDKEALYGDADLFALPTFSENFGLVVAEACSP